MKTIITSAIIALLVTLNALESPSEHIEKIEAAAPEWIRASSLTAYKSIVIHEAVESLNGGRVCYRAVKINAAEVICFEWENGLKIVDAWPLSPAVFL